MKHIIFLFNFAFFIFSLKLFAVSEEPDPIIPVDTLDGYLILFKSDKDTLRTFITNDDLFTSSSNGDFWTIVGVLVAGLGIYLAYRGVKKQLKQLTYQMHLIETELDATTKRFYYDKWLDIESGLTKDVLKHRHGREINETQMNEIIEFIKYLDIYLANLEVTKEFVICHPEDSTIYKTLQIDSYRNYWKKYIRPLYTDGTFFMNAMDNTITLIDKLQSTLKENKNQVMEEIIAGFNKGWENRIMEYRKKETRKKVEARLKYNEEERWLRIEMKKKKK